MCVDVCRSVSQSNIELLERKTTNRTAEFRKMTSLRLRCIFTNIASNLLVPRSQPVKNLQRFRHIKEIPTPKPGVDSKQYRRFVIDNFEVMRTVISTTIWLYLRNDILYFNVDFRLVHYPDDMKYTVKPLDVTNLAGRDPITGRVVSKIQFISTV